MEAKTPLEIAQDIQACTDDLMVTGKAGKVLAQAYLDLQAENARLREIVKSSEDWFRVMVGEISGPSKLSSTDILELIEALSVGDKG